MDSCRRNHDVKKNHRNLGGATVIWGILGRIFERIWPILAEIDFLPVQYIKILIWQIIKNLTYVFHLKYVLKCWDINWKWYSCIFFGILTITDSLHWFIAPNMLEESFADRIVMSRQHRPDSYKVLLSQRFRISPIGALN